MGFLDFFKKNKKQIVEVEKISQKEFPDWLLNKKSKIEKEEQEFLVSVRKRISELISELKEKISVVNKRDIDEIKAEDKFKLIVKQNLRNYLSYLDKLILRLEELDNEKNIIDKINLIFHDFQRKSLMSYEKATILIGKELAEIKESIRKFFKDISILIKVHQSMIDESKIIGSVKARTKEFNEFKKTKSGITENIDECNRKINNLEKTIKNKEEGIETLKKSERFIEEDKKKQELKKKKQDLDNDISVLGRVIDFKALSNFYHSFEKEMKIIKRYKENFKQTFHKTKGEDVFSLLKESNLYNVNILNKIQEIDDKKKQISNIVISETGLENLENTVRKLKLEIQEFDSNKIVKEKRLKKLEISLNDIMKLIKTELTKLNVELYV